MYDLGTIQNKLFKNMKYKNKKDNSNEDKKNEVKRNYSKEIRNEKRKGAEDNNEEKYITSSKLYDEVRKIIEDYMRRQISRKKGIASKPITDEVFSVLLGSESVLGLVILFIIYRNSKIS